VHWKGGKVQSEKSNLSSLIHSSCNGSSWTNTEQQHLARSGRIRDLRYFHWIPSRICGAPDAHSCGRKTDRNRVPDWTNWIPLCQQSFASSSYPLLFLCRTLSAFEFLSLSFSLSLSLSLFLDLSISISLSRSIYLYRALSPSQFSYTV
jgi:hypothetical protein